MSLQVPPALQVPLMLIAAVLGVTVLALMRSGAPGVASLGEVIGALVALVAAVRLWLPPGPPTGPPAVLS